MKIDAEVLTKMVTNEGKSLKDLSYKKPVLLIFLRHFGCTFCREALDDLSKVRNDIQRDGTQIVLVHMSDNKTADRYFNRYNLPNSMHISDPECTYYQAFGLVKGNLKQLFGLNVWMRGVQSAFIEGRGLGTFIGDGFQMPGIFLVQNGEIINSYIHEQASDRPDYVEIASCCSTPANPLDKNLTKFNLASS